VPGACLRFPSGHEQLNCELTRITTRITRIAPGAADRPTRKHNDKIVVLERRAQKRTALFA
jgi:hypothetical protein